MYYAELNFPSIPRELLIDPFESVEKQQGRYNPFGGESYFKNGQVINPCSYWVTGVKNVKLSSWLRNNIPGTKHLKRFCYQHAYHRTGGHHVVHSDIARNYAINYIVETGGEDAWTSWWREIGQPIKRNKKHGGGYNAGSLSTYNNLELLDTVKLTKDKWYLMSTDVLHDVGEIVGLRKSITINIHKDHEEKLLERISKFYNHVL